MEYGYGKLLKLRVLNLTTEEVFESRTEALLVYPKALHISGACRGKRKTAGGYRWAYYDEKVHGPTKNGKVKRK